jgi:hypothetical protein
MFLVLPQKIRAESRKESANEGNFNSQSNITLKRPNFATNCYLMYGKAIYLILLLKKALLSHTVLYGCNLGRSIL